MPEKAPGLVLDAARLLRERGVPVHAVIAGDGPLRPALEARVAAEGLGDLVEIAGPVGQHDLPARYLEADVFCLPSFAEGIPVVLMEAMLTELPVVTTAIAGIPELVHPDSGVLVQPGDAVAVADALQELAADPVCGSRSAGAAGRRCWSSTPRRTTRSACAGWCSRLSPPQRVDSSRSHTWVRPRASLIRADTRPAAYTAA